MRRDRYETTLSLAVSLIGRMQYGAGGGFDGLFFSRTNGSGSDAALWWRCRAASGRKQLAAWKCGGGSRITAVSVRASGRRSRLDRAGRSFAAELIRAIARAGPSVLKYDQCVPNHRVTEDTNPKRQRGRLGCSSLTLRVGVLCDSVVRVLSANPGYGISLCLLPRRRSLRFSREGAGQEV
jgi:hypothetical protein